MGTTVGLGLLKYRLKDNGGSTNRRNTGITDINHKINVSSDILQIMYFIASDVDKEVVMVEEEEETVRVSLITLRV